MKLILKISDFLLSTYLFIASAAACLVLETTILLTGKLQFTATSMLVFFSTILIYNFHRVSALFSDRFFSLPAFLDRSKKIPLSIKIMTGIALAGILISVTFVNIKTMFIILPLALLTFAYSVPLMKVKGEIKRLRELFLVKITTLAFVWSIATVTLPMVDSGINALSESAIAIFTERFLFMFAICVPFEIRDLDQEKNWGNTTLPLMIGVNGSKIIGIAALFLFCLFTYIQFTENIYSPPLFISAGLAALLILFSNQNRNHYYFRVFVDGTMQLQFILLILFINYQ